MNAKSNTAKPEDKAPQAQPEKKKTCFVIMPIADIPGYESNHFTRVYNHLIKPACLEAGFEATRADDSKSSHMIVIDILKKIVESDIVICDLSGKNPNVLYELGLRQAFNKKTVLIKDDKTDNIFDVQSFRYIQYDSNLRIDNVKIDIKNVSSSLKETSTSDSDINSIVQLLQIEPAIIANKTELTGSETLILRSVSELSRKIDGILSHENKPKHMFVDHTVSAFNIEESRSSFRAILNSPISIENYIGESFKIWNKELQFIDMRSDRENFTFIDENEKIYNMDISDVDLDIMTIIPSY